MNGVIDILLPDKFMYTKDGEQIVCKKCGRTITITQKVPFWERSVPGMLLDVAVEKKSKNNRLARMFYQTEGICRDCMDENDLLFDDDYILFRYLRQITKVQISIKTLTTQAIESFRKNVSEDMLREIDEDAYNILKSTNHHGAKSEKRQAALEYIDNADKKVIDEYIFKYIENERKELFVKENVWIELKRLEAELLEELRKWDDTIIGYVRVGSLYSKMLHPYLEGARFVKKKTELGEYDMYEDFEYSRKSVERLIYKTQPENLKFSRGSISCRTIREKLPAIISKLDF